jgi:HD-GYP domain-containing protein (c-di-GMP phosphodiesterase class II)
MLIDNISDQLSDSSLEIVLNHHERYNGSGYPRGIKKDEIGDMSGICALSDIYNAMTTERVYRKAFPPNEAYELIMAYGDLNFKLKLVKLFASCVCPYPVGTLVLLSTGQAGCVTSANRNLAFRPVITLLETKEKIDLSRELAVVIKRSLTVEEAQSAIVRFTLK